MATDKNISALIESQVPEYLREEGPKLVAFLKAYYEWMETTNQVTEQSKNLLPNQDIDTTNLNKFYDYFRREVMVDFPTSFLADKRQVAKRIRDLYQSKGSKLSYKLLFRILYDEEIDFVNPADYILKTSDGRWSQDTLVRLGPPFKGDLDSLLGQFVTGQTSGARGRVIEISNAFELGIEVKQFVITDVLGTFVDLEEVANDNDTISGTILNTIGSLSDVTFDNQAQNRGGSGHQIGDIVSLSAAAGAGAVGKVISTTENAVTFKISNGGSGFRVSNTTLSTDGTVVTVSGGSGSGGSVKVTAISNTETVFAYTDKISVLANTAIGFNSNNNYGDAASTITTPNNSIAYASANLQSANVATPLSAALGTIETTVGTIKKIVVTTGNYFVNLPIVNTVDQEIANLELPDGSGGIKGKNAIISPVFIPGAIADIEVTTPGAAYSATNPVTATNTTRTGTTDALGTPVISGVLTSEGRYVGSKGFLSSDMRLQDNYYYQEYSYVIKSQRGLQVYRDLVNNILHPAGTKMFGRIDLSTEIDFSAQAEVDTTVNLNLIKAEQQGELTIVPPATQLGTPIVDYAFDLPSISSTTSFGIHNVGKIIDPSSLGPTSTFGTPTTDISVTPVTIANTVVGGGLSIVSGDSALEFTIDVDSFGPTTTFGTLTTDISMTPVTIANTVVGGGLSIVSGDGAITFNVDPVTISPTTTFSTHTVGASSIEAVAVGASATTFGVNTLLLVGQGTVSVANNNTVDGYLASPVDGYLDSDILTLGSPFYVVGSNTLFTTVVKAGSVIEIEDIDPGATGNTTYIVNTVFSNTSLRLNTTFGEGSALANGIFRYSYDGNI